ncbi:MAG TPA: tRNA 2-selenouridine(34) synthase MnmH [Nanoarchaeota archaeon]|nr:tRNA 2-selenouridine(34) synthase MnmH [Nanoarchaeota archaeon]
MKKIEEVYGKAYLFVDVRSPKEFAEDHIPRAVNIPLFSNEERAIVGTLYKQVGKDMAINKGLEIVGHKLPEMIQEYQEYKEKKIVVYCWRGGMRSGSVVSLLKSLEFDVEQLEKGYKDYRRFVREELDRVPIPPLVILYALTGSGKTEMLQQLENSIDLEGLAQHRGSIFGDVGLKPRTQKMFDSLLLQRLYEIQEEDHVFIEGESRKIGNTMIPLRLWNMMQKATKVKVLCPTEQRVERLYKEYCHSLDVPLLVQKIHYIEQHLGKKKAEDLIEMLEAGKVKEVIQIILLEYYDTLYKHTVDSKEYSFEVHTVKELESCFA